MSLTVPAGILCAGGSDAERHYPDVFLLRWNPDTGRAASQSLPPLPQPTANACGALLGNRVYLAGGTTDPNATRTLHGLWTLDLANPTARWEPLEPWPGRGRMLAVAAVQAGSFFLLGGVDLSPAPDGTLRRTYLTDAYRFTPGTGWIRAADLPHPVTAAPSPAPACGPNQFLVLGGDDGSRVGYQPAMAHPGFSLDILRYDTATDQWTPAGTLPAGPVTAPAVPWQDSTVVVSGEIRPGRRTPAVLQWRLNPTLVIPTTPTLR